MLRREVEVGFCMQRYDKSEKTRRPIFPFSNENITKEYIFIDDS